MFFSNVRFHRQLKPGINALKVNKIPQTHRAGHGILFVVVGTFLLMGCAGAHIHDASKSALAQGAKTKYEEVRLLQLVETQGENLNGILQEELEVVQNNYEVRSKLGLMSLSISDKPIAVTLKNSNRIKRRMKRLGVSDATSSKTLREFVNATGSLDFDFEGIVEWEGIMLEQFGNHPPSCVVKLNKEQKVTAQQTWNNYVKQASGDEKENAQSAAKDYDELCQEYKDSLAMVKEKTKGDFRKAYEELNDAKKILAKRRLEIRKQDKLIKEVKAKLRKLTKGPKESDMAKGQEILKVLKKVTDKGEELGLEGIPDLRIEAIDKILVAIASGQTEMDPTKDPDLAGDVKVAQEVPSLKDGLENFIKRNGLLKNFQPASPPPISSLIIAKEYEQLKREYAQSLTEKAQRRVKLVEEKIAALRMEIRQLLEMHDGICQYVRYASGDGKRIDCDSLVVEAKEINNTGKFDVTCTFKHGKTGEPAAKNTQTVTLAGIDCPLSKTLKDALTVNKPRAKRALYMAIANYNNSTAIARAHHAEASYKLVHLSHEEAAESDRLAIRTWNSLIATPINQLDAYHASGIKPEDLGDILAKLLGLTAIAIGVAQ